MLEPFLEYFMLADVPLGRDATPTEVLWARAEKIPAFPEVEDLKNGDANVYTTECSRHEKVFLSGLKIGPLML